jgi:hypothetical protein
VQVSWLIGCFVSDHLLSSVSKARLLLQTEVSTMSSQVGFYDHRRALLTAENVLLKQKLAALSQSQRYKEGEYRESLFPALLLVYFCRFAKTRKIISWTLSFLCVGVVDAQG